MAIYGSVLGDGLGADRRAYLDKMLLENTAQNTMYDRLATITKPLPLKNSQRVEFEKWITMKNLYFADNLNDNFTGNVVANGEESLMNVGRDEYKNFMLEEGSSGASKGSMKLIKLSTDVFSIGDWMPYTEELELFHNRWSTTEAVRQMSEMSGMVIDGFYRDLYFYGAGHIYDISGDGAAADDVEDAAFSAASKKLVTALKLSGAKEVSSVLSSSPNYGTVPVNAKFVAYGHVAAIDAMENNADWIEVEKYADRVTLLPNERGMLKNIRYVEDPDGYIELVSGTTYIAEFVVGGKDHTAQVPLRGKGKLETVYQAIGSGGTSDPLKRVGSLGWKGWLGAKVLYPERLGILKARFVY